MRLSDTDKLYKKLSPTQAANMAFEASVRQDDREREAIMDIQPQFHFVGASEAYRRRVGGLVNLAFVYGTVYWRTRTWMLQVGYSGGNNAVTKAITKMGSVEQALIETCRQLGVDIVAIKSLGFCNVEYSFVEYADVVLTAEYTEIFLGIVH
jgi:mannose/fructose/N-acetylgalactosamine-specific phosphotransferase system component IID